MLPIHDSVMHVFWSVDIPHFTSLTIAVGMSTQTQVFVYTYQFWKKGRPAYCTLPFWKKARPTFCTLSYWKKHGHGFFHNCKLLIAGVLRPKWSSTKYSNALFFGTTAGLRISCRCVLVHDSGLRMVSPVLQMQFGA